MGRIGAGASVPPLAPWGGRLHGDDRGQLLILTGVLLVLGFVVIGTTVVQMRGLEDSTARLERDALLDSVDGLVDTFNLTIVESIELGDTNVTDFAERVDLAESRLRDTATRAGVYVSVELDPDVDKSIFWRDSRCLAYNINEWEKKNGIVIGWERGTSRESIVGAAYDVHITDGRQTVRMTYYVKIFECMVQNTPSHIEEAEAEPGTLFYLPGSNQKDDGATFWVNETLNGTVLKQIWTAPEAINTTAGWLNEENIITESNAATKSLEVNWIDFNLEVPADLQYTHSIPNFTISVHTQDNQVGDDILHLEAYDKYDLTQEIVYDFQVPLQAVKTNHTFKPPLSPEGNTHWTRWDLENMTWRLRVEPVLVPDLGRTIKVYYVTANVTWEQPEGYHVVATFDFEEIPPVFDQHRVEARYRYEHPVGATPETFLLQVYDDEDDAWETLDTWSASASWATSGPWLLAVDPDNDQSNDNKPRFRIVDVIPDDDQVSEDRHSIEIDWFELTSSVSGI